MRSTGNSCPKMFRKCWMSMSARVPQTIQTIALQRSVSMTDTFVSLFVPTAICTTTCRRGQMQPSSQKSIALRRWALSILPPERSV